MLKQLTALVAVVSTVTLTAANPVTLRVNPRMGMAPQTVTVFVKIEPHEANRYLNIAVAGTNKAEASLEQLEGLNAPEARTKQFKNLPAGWYLARATVIRNNNTKFYSEMEFCLGGPNFSCTD